MCPCGRFRNARRFFTKKGQKSFAERGRKLIERGAEREKCYLSSLTLKVFEIIIGHGGDGTAAPAATPARAHRVEIPVLEIAALVVRGLVSVSLLLLFLLLSHLLLFLPTNLNLLPIRVVRSRVENRPMIYPGIFFGKERERERNEISILFCCVFIFLFNFDLNLSLLRPTIVALRKIPVR